MLFWLLFNLKLRNMKKITFAIPTRNRRENLKKNLVRLAPLLDEHCVLFIIDNGSNYPVAEAISEALPETYSFELIVVINKTNLGAVTNVLRCFELCNTEWIYLVGDSKLVSNTIVLQLREDIKKHKQAAFINYYYADKQHSQRTNTVITKGIYEFIYNMGSFGNLILIGNSLYNVKRLIANLPQAYMYGSSHAAHISLVITSIKDDTCCVLSKETIIDKFLEKPSGTQTQTIIDCWVGFSTMMDLVSNDRARKLLGRTISGASGAKTESFFIFIKSILLYSRDYGRLRANYFLNRVVSLRYYYGVNILERMLIIVVTMIFKIPFLHKFFIYLIKRK